MQGIDFIGDLHGHATLLRRLLGRLGYREGAQGFFHPERRRVVFLGDLLNRGPEIRETVQIVRGMVDSGIAECLLGNHELFAIWEELRVAGFPGVPEIPEKAKRHLTDSHAVFLGQPEFWSEFLRWLWERPVFFDNGRVRAVHACWDEHAVSVLRGRKLQMSWLRPGRREFHALWRLIEGTTIRCPENRQRFRIRWWDREARTYAEFAYREEGERCDWPLPNARKRLASPYPASAPICFFGHFGFAKPLSPLRRNLACLDLGVAKGGPIAAYRWDGERALNKTKFVTEFR